MTAFARARQDEGDASSPSITNALLTAPPPPAFERWIAHYWCSFGNRDLHYDVIPDRCVDLVAERSRDGLRWTVSGSASRLRAIPLRPDADYFGIRFRPGQARHFIDLPVADLIDRDLPFPDCMRGRRGEDSLETVAEPEGAYAVFDAMLTRHFARHPPEDGVLDALLRDPGVLSVDDILRALGTGRRRAERLFRDVVGLSPGLFARIGRFERTLQQVRHAAGATLTRIAHENGYADHSHMDHEFQRLSGRTPSAWRIDVANRQDGSAPTRNTDVS